MAYEHEKDFLEKRISPQRETTSAPNQPQVQYVVAQPTKNIGIALVLTLLFGPIGLFYCSVFGGIVMLVVCGFFDLLGILMMGWGLLITIPFGNLLCAIWAFISAKRYNSNLMSGNV